MNMTAGQRNLRRGIKTWERPAPHPLVIVAWVLAVIGGVIVPAWAWLVFRQVSQAGARDVIVLAVIGWALTALAWVNGRDRHG